MQSQHSPSGEMKNKRIFWTFSPKRKSKKKTFGKIEKKNFWNFCFPKNGFVNIACCNWFRCKYSGIIMCYCNAGQCIWFTEYTKNQRQFEYGERHILFENKKIERKIAFQSEYVYVCVAFIKSFRDKYFLGWSKTSGNL